MNGIFSTLGYLLLIAAGVAMGALLVSAITGFKSIDKSMLWSIFWGALITGVLLVLLGTYLVLPPSHLGQ